MHDGGNREIAYVMSNGRTFSERPEDGNYAVRGWEGFHMLWEIWDSPVWGS